MNTLNLSKVVLTIVMTTQLMGTNTSHAADVPPETFANPMEESRYFQLESRSVIELSEDEAESLINESEETDDSQDLNDVTIEQDIVVAKRGLTTKELTLPIVPPRFPTSPTTGSLVTPTTTPTPTATGIFDNVIMVVDKLIAIGQKIIPTIEKGKAVVTNNPMTAVSVLPRLETRDIAVHDMGGWSLPVSRHYKIAYNNGFGKEVISFIYSVSFQYGGSHDGKGKYLTGIRASARNIKIKWGFDIDASSQLIQISNIGTKENVIAAAKIEMSYTVKNWTGTEAAFVGFFVTGDGRLYKED